MRYATAPKTATCSRTTNQNTIRNDSFLVLWRNCLWAAKAPGQPPKNASMCSVRSGVRRPPLPHQLVQAVGHKADGAHHDEQTKINDDSEHHAGRLPRMPLSYSMPSDAIRLWRLAADKASVLCRAGRTFRNPEFSRSLGRVDNHRAI